MSTSLSRFQIVEGNPPHLPNKCSVCGSINGTFIDFGLDLEFYGTVYLCVGSCIRQLASELGFYSPSQHRAVQQSEARLRKENNDLRDRLELMTNGMAALRRIDSYSSDGSDSAGNPGMEHGKEGGSKPESDTGITPAEHGSNKQADEQRHSDLLTDDGLSALFARDANFE